MEPVVDIVTEPAEAKTTNVSREIRIMSERERYNAFLNLVGFKFMPH